MAKTTYLRKIVFNCGTIQTFTQHKSGIIIIESTPVFATVRPVCTVVKPVCTAFRHYFKYTKTSLYNGVNQFVQSPNIILKDKKPDFVDVKPVCSVMQAF
jgi:hypothetical protein